jgi:CRISPR-associated exonuclease Cas4
MKYVGRILSWHLPDPGSRGGRFNKYYRSCFLTLIRGIILAAQTDPVTISELVRVHSCPVRFYYERHIPVVESARYAVCKQLSYHLGNPLVSEGIWNEVVSVMPGIDPEMRTVLETCITSCNRNTWKVADQHDVRVTSDRHGITGMVDRMWSDGTFSIIRAAGAMPFGTYAADRLRIACIALCLEEMTGTEVCGGNVEYIPDGVTRFHTVQPRDRRQVIATLHKIRQIRGGDIPQQPLNAPCSRCGYKERCENLSGRKLSDLL